MPFHAMTALDHTRHASDTTSPTSPREDNPLGEALRCLAVLTGAHWVAVLRQRGERFPIASTGAATADVGLRIAQRAWSERAPIWIRDGAAANPLLRAEKALDVAFLPIRCDQDSAPVALVVARQATGDWADETRKTIERFVPLVTSLLCRAENPVYDERGVLIGMTGAARDLTERSELEAERRRLIEELELERDRWSELIANVPGVVWEQQFDGSYRFIGDQIETLLGYTTDEYVRTFASFLDAVHEDDRAAVMEEDAEILARRHGSHVFRMKRKDGTYVWCESHCRAITDASGAAIGMRGVTVDVTLRKHAEEELRASEEHFRSLANATAMMIWTSDANGQAQFQSRRLVGFAGTSMDELTGSGWQKLLHPDDAERIGATWQEAHAKQTWLSFEGRFLRHDGVYREMLAEGAPRYASDGTFIGFAGNCVDITDRKRMERRGEEDRRLTSLGRLAATIAHEINNVLMGVQPFADVIRKTADAPLLLRAADHISNSVQRGRRITHEILRFANTSDPVRESIDVTTWLTEISDELQTVLGPGIDLCIDVRERGRMLADHHQMAQALTNLAANARDAMSSSGTLTISCTNEQSWPGLPAEDGPFIHFVISDTGSGIPQHAIDHLFDPLFTTKQHGTGLGLAIVRDVVRRHQGDIVVENPDGRGAIFHLLLPSTDQEPAVRSESSGGMPPCVKRILFVEDDEIVALASTQILELEDVTAAVVSRGADALDGIARFHPDLVVLDIGLPDMPGTAVFDMIRREHPTLPVLFSTGHAGELEGKIEQMSGPTAHLLKPYDFSTLAEIVGKLMERSAM